MKVRVVSVGLVLAALCAARPAHAVGESIAGFPNYAERVLHEWTNRARSDPAFEMAKCGANCPEASCYAPVAPVHWNEWLNHAARFHSAHMTRGGYSTTIQHDSNCVIASDIKDKYPTPCNGEAACSCSGPGTTSASARVSRFGVGYSGEIIASSTTPTSAFYAWLFEKATDTACKFSIPNGHRWLLLTGGPGIGFGVDGRSTGDFGTAGEKHKIPSGIHDPRSGPSVELWANWYDTAAPKTARVNVAGTCTPLTLARGSDTNGAWTTKLDGLSGCTRYYFAFEDSTGASITYPTSGSLGIGPAASCPDWSTERPTGCGTCTPSCAGKTCGPDGCGGSCGSCAGAATCTAAGTCASPPDAGAPDSGAPDSGAPEAGATDSGTAGDAATTDSAAPPVDDGGAPDFDAAIPSDDASPASALDDEGALEGSCGCRAASRSHRAGFAALALAVVVGARRRRR